MATERDFIEAIDCRFPYASEAEWMAAVDRGAAISPNAAFMVLHEICRPPEGIRPSASQLMKIYEYWSARFSHPGMEIVREAALALIEGRSLPADDAVRLIHALEEYPDISIALDVVVMAVGDQRHIVREAAKGVRARWKVAS
jgi:hypothetical protein